MERDNEILFKANTLIKSNVSLSSIEFKVFNKILYKCQVSKESEIQMVASLSLDELREIVKKKNDSTPKALSEMLDKFVSIPIKFKIENEIVTTSLINTVKIDINTLNYTCYLNKDLYKVLIGYKEIGYSPIDLKLTKSVKGYYTQKFYELFRMWSGTKNEVTYTIDELKKWLMIEEGNSYDLYANFKNKIIAPAVKEITEKLNMEVSYKENKVSRRVHSITFAINDKEPRKYDFEETAITKIDKETVKYKKSTAKTKTKKGANFNERIYDYDSLETQLLGHYQN